MRYAFVSCVLNYVTLFNGKVSCVFLDLSLIFLVLYYRASAFIPDPARVYGCRVLELTKNGISEDDAMSVANVLCFLFTLYIVLLLIRNTVAEDAEMFPS